MYSTTKNGRTTIMVGGNDKSRVEPLYSVPIQTTATLNIQFLMPKVAASATSVTASGQNVQSGRTTSIRSTATSSLPTTKVNTASEVPYKQVQVRSDDFLSSSATQTDLSSSFSSSLPDFDPRRSLDASSQIGASTYSSSQTGFSDTDSLAGFSPSASQIGTPSANRSFVSESQTDLPVIQLQVETLGASAPKAGSTGGTSSSSSSSLSSSSNPVVSSSAAASSSGSVVGRSSRDADEEEGKEYRVFSDVGGGTLSSNAAALKLLQGVHITSEASAAAAGSGAGDGDDSDDENWEELGKPAGPSTFNVIEWDLPNGDKSYKNLACSRVIIMKDREMVLMLKATCSTVKTGNDSRLLNLMVEIADNCSKRLRKMKTRPDLCAQHMDTLPLGDGRTTKEHLDEISQTLGDNVCIKEVAYRFQPPDDVYIGTFVQGTVLAKKNYAIGKVGVVAVLHKKSKYATVEAFSEQLCEHIAITIPLTLGQLSDTDLKRLNRKGTMRIRHLQKDQLLIQNFVFDPTIIVAEAARRSFVRIVDFLLFK